MSVATIQIAVFSHFPIRCFIPCFQSKGVKQVTEQLAEQGTEQHFAFCPKQRIDERMAYPTCSPSAPSLVINAILSGRLASLLKIFSIFSRISGLISRGTKSLLT